MEQLKNNTAELQEILDTINTLPEKFDTSDANVTANKMLAGYSGYANGQKVEGNIQSKGADTITPGTTAKYIEPGVYLAGRQTIAAIQTETRTVTANGTYTPSSGKYFSSVTVNTPVGYKSGDVVKATSISLTLGTSYLSVSVTYGTSVVNTNGVLSLGDSTSVTASSASDLDVVKGKYVQISSTIYYIPTDASITQTGTMYNKSYTTNKANPVFVIA